MAHILVIDDDAIIRRMLMERLTDAGYQVFEAGHGNEGLKVMRAEPADLVLCDLYMPEKEGLETIQELRRNYPELKIIAMSGGNRKSPVDLLPIAKSMGANETIHKPFKLAELVQLIDSMLSAG
ncbi:response regulator [soil metagenome]